MFSKLLKNRIEKKYKDQKEQRTAFGYSSSITGIVVNTVLFAIKLFIGIITNSISLIADSINNLSDTATGFVGILGFKLSSKPADQEHPFGHGRTEYISSLVVSFIILIIGYELIKDSLSRIFNPTFLEVNWIVMGILFITILVKLWLSHFYKKIGNEIESQVLKAASADSFNDVWATASVLLSFIVFHYSGFIIDGYMGVLVAIFIMYNGVTFIRGSVDTIIGDKPDEDLIDKIKQFVLNYDGIISVHDVIVHDYGPLSKMTTAHVEISSNLSLLVAHEIIDRIEEGIQIDMGISLLLHMDPIEVDCAVTNDIKDTVMSVLERVEGIKSIHDFRVIEESISYTVFFQINMDEQAKENLNEYKDKVLQLLEQNLQYTFIINIKKENLFIY